MQADDPEAIDKLNKLRTKKAEALPIIGQNLLISDDQKKHLTGKHRVLNATEVTMMSDAAHKRFTALWMVLPPAKGGAYFLEPSGEKPLFGGPASKPPWYKALAVMNGFTGLLEVGKPASLALFYGIPADMDPSGLRLEIEGQGGIVPTIEEHKAHLR